MGTMGPTKSQRPGVREQESGQLDLTVLRRSELFLLASPDHFPFLRDELARVCAVYVHFNMHLLRRLRPFSLFDVNNLYYEQAFAR